MTTEAENIADSSSFEGLHATTRFATITICSATVNVPRPDCAESTVTTVYVVEEKPARMHPME